MKILCTGNPNKLTIANSVQKIFTNVDFVYKSNGFDLTSIDGVLKLRDTLDFYDVFINASRIDIGVQYNILSSITTWNGHAITIGSVLEYDKYKHVDPLVSEDKKRLRNLSLNLCSKTLKTTYIVVGGINNDYHADKMDPIHIAKTIKWILDQTEFHVPLIGVENEILR
jgi:hypothetical protein